MSQIAAIILLHCLCSVKDYKYLLRDAAPMRPLTDVMRSTSGGVAANIRALTPSYLDPLWSTLLRLEFWSPLFSSEFSLLSCCWS